MDDVMSLTRLLLRQLLTAGGAWLAARGWGDAATWGAVVEPGVGALLFLIGAGWSAAKWRERKVLEAKLS